MSDEEQKENEKRITLDSPTPSTSGSAENSEFNSSAFDVPILGRKSISGLLNFFGSTKSEEEKSIEPIKEEELSDGEESSSDGEHLSEKEESLNVESEPEIMTSVKCPQIDRFDGKNFASWMAQMEAILFLNDLWIDLASTAEELADARMLLKAKKAYMHIITRCDKEHVNFLEAEAKGNSVMALNLLKSKYDRDSTINKVAELRNAMLMRYNHGSLEEHINSMQSRYQKLKCHGLDLPHLVQAANLIISMPSEYDGVVSSFLRMKDSDLKFQDLAEALLDEEKRRSMMNYKSTEEIAQASTFQKIPQQIDRRPPIKCGHCGKRGHYAKICRSKNQQNESHSDSKPGKYNNFSHNKGHQNSSTPRAKFSEYNEDDGETTMYSNVAYYSKISRPLDVKRRQTSYKDFRGNHFDEKRTDKRNVVVENRFSKRTKICEQIRYDSSPERKQRELSLPPTPGHRMEQYLDASSSAGTENSILQCVSPVLSINGSLEMLNKIDEDYENCFNCNIVERKNANWILDSGASLHMSYNKLLFQDLIIKPGGKIRIADGNFIEIMGFGTVKVLIKTKFNPLIFFLKNVAYVPALHTNLLSVHCLTKDNFKISFEKEIAQIQINNEMVHFAEFKNNNYVLVEALYERAMVCIDELHKRMAHRNIRDIKRLSEFGLEISKCNCSHQCDACMKSKSTDLSFPKKSEKPDEPLDIIVADVCGRMREESIGGKSYFLTITDLHSDYTEVKFLRNKNDANLEIRNFIEFVKNQFSRKPRIFRTDRGGEFVDTDLQNYLREQGIKIELTTPDSPQQNGVAERKNRTLNDAVRTLLISSQLPNKLWAEAMNNVVYTFNRIIRKGQKSSPIEIFFNKKANGIFLEFGSQVYVNTKKHNRGKYDPRAVVMRFLSVDDNSKGFRLWTGNKVIISRNVRPKINIELDYENPLTDINLRNEPEKISKQEITSVECKSNHEEEILPVLRRSERIADIKKTTQCANISSSDSDPKTYSEAIKSAKCEEWIAAMNEEIISLKETGTYELTDLPSNKNAIGCKWVFKTKPEKDGIRYKARLVAQGFSQKFGQDYNEVFAPVARAPTIRLLLSLAGKRNLIVKQFDVKTAFLNGELEEEIYMCQPPGFKNGDKVFRLRKSLYGLKQAARSWNSKLNKSLSLNGFTQSESDDCLFVRKVGSQRIYIVCHVDDMIFASTSNALIDETYKKLSSIFEMKDLGEVHDFLGVEIYKTTDGFAINQSKYITKIASELGVADSKPQKYPIDPGYYAIKCDEFLNCNNEFRKIIGMLLYISTNTRPDISASVCILAQRVEKPRKIDLSEAMRVVKYLNGTKNHKLKLYNAKKSQDLLAYSDANFAECKIEGKSNSGLVCFVNGGPIVWKCRKQTNVALSTTEAEYYAITEAAKEVLWLHTLLNDFEIDVNEPTIILNDNQSTISMLTNGDFMQRTKYIGVKYHFLRDWIKRQKIDVQYCPTEHNIADLLTKPLSGIRIENLRIAAGLFKPS